VELSKIVSEERVVRCLAEKIERCLTFYDFPAADWSKIRANNVAERAFRFVRQRQRPMGAFTNQDSAERIFGALGGEWNRREELSPRSDLHNLTGALRVLAAPASISVLAPPNRRGPPFRST
jgi:hypothetical protein